MIRKNLLVHILFLTQFHVINFFILIFNICTCMYKSRCRNVDVTAYICRFYTNASDYAGIIIDSVPQIIIPVTNKNLHYVEIMLKYK